MSETREQQPIRERLPEILAQHAAWLRGEPEGTRANLSRANLSRANFSWADLSGADLSRANLSMANLSRANLSMADLSEADLSMANLSEANLSRANLSGAAGLLDAAGWLAEHLEQDAAGILAYKALPSPQRRMPEHWRIEPGAMLTEIVNPDRGTDCGSGVNVGTLEWVRANYPNKPIWRCRIAWLDLAGVVVPFGTAGKFRAGRVTLLEATS